MPKEKSNDVDDKETLSLEDCNALLKFVSEIKKEVETDVSDSKVEVPLVEKNDANSSVSKPVKKIATGNLKEELKIFQKKNVAIQEKIVEALSIIETAVRRLDLGRRQAKVLHKEELKEEMPDKSKRGALLRPISLFAAPYFRDIRGMVPPDNEDTLAKTKNNIINAYLVPPKPWMPRENKMLVNGVMSNTLAEVLKPYQIKRNYLKEKLKDKNISDSEIQEIKEELITEIEMQINEIKKIPVTDLYEKRKSDIDWMTISATYMEGMRDPEECENMWNNFLNNSINKKPFTAAEDAKLREIAERHNELNWDIIAKELGTNRTAIQCFSRYQSHVNKNFVKSVWTPEEDEQLINIVNLLRIDNYIPWNKVCFYMDGRKRHQIINRYERSISREVNRSPWTTEEDAMLIVCIKKFGYHWSKMREFFPRRCLHSMRERYFNNLDPELKIGDWSKEEDQKLIRLVKEIGYGKWSKIANEMPGRTDNMCLMRTSILTQYSKGFQSYSSEDEDDPEKIVKILKPVAPTKNCVFKNNKLKTIQNNAMNALLNAMKKVLPELSSNLNLEKFDFPSLSLHLLRGVYKELFSNGHEKESICWESEAQRRRRKVKKEFPESDDEATKSRFKKLDYSGEGGSDSEEIDNLIEQSQKEEEKLDPAKHRWLRKFLEQKFREAASVSLSFSRKKNLAMNGRETAECSLYRSYLYKNFHCSRPFEEVFDSENSTFNGIDYSVTLADVVYHFIHPPISRFETMIITPNVMTLNAMEVLEVTKPRMENMSKFVDHSLPYIQYLTGDNNNCSKCLFCLNVEKKESQELQQEKFKSVLKSMKENFMIVDGDLEEAVAYETASGDTTNKCICDELAKSKEAFTVFNKRFFSLFLWPTLISGVKMSQEQENLINPDKRSKYFCGSTSEYSLRGKYHSGAEKKHKRKRKCGKRKLLEDTDDDEICFSEGESGPERKRRKYKRRIKIEPSEDIETQVACSSQGKNLEQSSNVKEEVCESDIEMPVPHTISTPRVSQSSVSQSACSPEIPQTPVRRSHRLSALNRKSYKFLTKDD